MKAFFQAPENLVFKTVLSSIDNVSNDLLNEISNQFNELDFDASCTDAIRVISMVEEHVKKSLNIPTFEILHQGTFLHYLTLNHPKVILNIFNRLILLKQNVSSNSNVVSEVGDFEDDDMLDLVTRAIVSIPKDVDDINGCLVKELHLIESIVVENCGLKSFINTGESFLSFLSRNIEASSDSISLLNFQQQVKDMVSKFAINESFESSEIATNSLVASVPSYSVSEKLIECAIKSYFKQVQPTVTRNELISQLETILSYLFPLPDTAVKSQSQKAVNNYLQSTNMLDKGDESVFVFHMKPIEAEKLTAIPDLHNRALKLLSSAPLGYSCSDYLLWKDLFQNNLIQGDSMSLLDFIVENDEQLNLLNPRVRFYAIPGQDDCIPVTLVLPSFEDISFVLSKHDFGTVASWCISMSDNEKFKSYLRANFIQFETFGIDWFNKVIEVTIHLICHFDILQFQYDVAIFVLEICADVGQVAYSTVQDSIYRKVFVYPNSYPMKYRTTILRLGMMYSKRFPVFSNFAFGLGTKKLNYSLSNTLTDSDSSETSHFIELTPSKTDTKTDTETDTTTSTLKSANNNNNENSMTTFSTTESSDHKAFVTKLLIDRFEYSADGSSPSMISQSKRMLENALQKLSGELYSSDVHFVMELLQNADDNDYLPSQTPTIKVKLYQQEVFVLNNEIGFTESNISAICNIGSSTKAGKMGYIGQKGIGFKSVFSVSNAPEIHSNGKSNDTFYSR